MKCQAILIAAFLPACRLIEATPQIVQDPVVQERASDTVGSIMSGRWAEAALAAGGLIVAAWAAYKRIKLGTASYVDAIRDDRRRRRGEPVNVPEHPTQA